MVVAVLVVHGRLRQEDYRFEEGRGNKKSRKNIDVSLRQLIRERHLLPRLMIRVHPGTHMVEGENTFNYPLTSTCTPWGLGIAEPACTQGLGHGRDVDYHPPGCGESIKSWEWTELSLLTSEDPHDLGGQCAWCPQQLRHCLTPSKDPDCCLLFRALGILSLCSVGGSGLSSPQPLRSSGSVPFSRCEGNCSKRGSRGWRPRRHTLLSHLWLYSSRRWPGLLRPSQSTLPCSAFRTCCWGS